MEDLEEVLPTFDVISSVALERADGKLMEKFWT
jgi:hypothetical protein